MKRLTLPLAGALLAGALGAQSSRCFVSPLGAEFEEGYAASAVQFGFADANTQSRTQQIDDTFAGFGFPMILRGIAWRRDGVARPNSIARTGDIEVKMSHADFNAATSSYGSNYKDNPVTVFTLKQVNLPDWTAAPAFTPSEFDLVLPFDAPFIYNRQDALLYDLVVRNLSSPLSYHMDFYRDNQLNYGVGQHPTLLGPGCTTKNGEMVQSCCLRAGSGGFEVNFRLRGAPSSAPVYALIGTSDPNILVPGLCAGLHTNFLFVLPAGTTRPDGTLPPTLATKTAWKSVYAGAVFYTQCMAVDPSQPFGVVLSSAQRCPAPLSNVKKSLPMHMVYSPRDSFALSGTLEKIIGCPTMFLY